MQNTHPVSFQHWFNWSFHGLPTSIAWLSAKISLVGLLTSGLLTSCRFTIDPLCLYNTDPMKTSMVYELLLFGCQPKLAFGSFLKPVSPNLSWWHHKLMMIMANIDNFWKKIKRHLWEICLPSITTISRNCFAKIFPKIDLYVN